MNDDDLAIEVVRRWEELDGERGTWRAHWQELLDHVMPRKADITSMRAAGEKRTEKQFDGTACDAVDEMVSLLFNNMTSPSQRWFSMDPVGAQGDRDVHAWLDRSVDLLLSEYRRSNLYQQLLEAYVDLVTIGTAAVFSEEQPIERAGFNGFSFRTLPIAEFVIDTDHQGTVDTVYRRFEMTARQAMQKWGDKAGPAVREAFADPRRRDSMLSFIHGLMPRDDRRWHDRRSVAMPVRSVYVAERDKCVIGEAGFHEMPIHVARWSTAAGERYGRSPAMKALPFVKVLNLIVRYGLEALPRALYPPMLVKEGTIVGGTLRLTPGAQNQFDGRAEDMPTELVTQARFDIEHAKEESYRQRIEMAFGVDQMRLKDSPQMTAEEVIERRSRRFQALSPATGRVERELLKPLVERTWLMMFRAGAFGDPPPRLLEARDVEVVFEGPMARAQRGQSLETGMNLLQTLSPIGQIYPGVRDHFDAEAFARDAAVALGAGKYLRDSREIAAERQAGAEQQAEAQQLDQGLAVADTLARMQGGGAT